MGVVKVLENQEDSKYNTTIIRDMERATAKKIVLQADIVKNNNLIPTLNTQIADKQIEIDDAVFLLNSAIDIINASILPDDEKHEAIIKATKEFNDLLFKLNIDKQNLEDKVSRLKLENEAKQKTIELIEAKEVLENRVVWGVDYQDEHAANDEVLSIEIARKNEHILVDAYTYFVTTDDVQDATDVLTIKNTNLADLNIDLSDKQTDIASQKIVVKAARISYNESTSQNKQVALNYLNTQTELLLELLANEKLILRDIEKLNDSIIRTSLLIDTLQNAIDTNDNILVPVQNSLTQKLQPVISSSPEASFYNTSLLPGYQKWLPTYRTGIITFIDKNLDTCGLTIDDETGFQDLNINQYSTLENVPIHYGRCNSSVFEVNDAVVIRWDEKSNGGLPAEIIESPKVIGFYSNPVACGFEFVYFMQSNGEVYEYRIDGSKRRFIFDLNANITRGLAIGNSWKNENVYDIGFDGTTGTPAIIHKDGVAISTAVAPNPPDTCAHIFSDGLFLYVQVGEPQSGYPTGTRRIAKYNFDGTYDSSITIPDADQIYHLMSKSTNSYISVVSVSPDYYTRIYNSTGTLLASHDYNNYFNFADLTCASRELLCYLTDEGGQINVFVINELGTKVGTLVFTFAEIDNITGDLLSEQPKAIAITEKYIFIYTGSKTVTGRVLIYNIVITKNTDPTPLPILVTKGTLVTTINTEELNKYTTNNADFASANLNII